MSKNYTAEVQEDLTGALFIQLPDELLSEVGWKEGDTIEWYDNKDGTFTMTKQETEWVLVDCVSTFRQRYMVEVPKGKKEWALDTVTMNEAKEFSQEHLGEQIVSHRVVTKSEALSLCDQDNDYTVEWAEDKKVEVFFTTLKDQNMSDAESKYAPAEDWTDVDWSIFSAWVKGVLLSGVATVTFTKKDGTERVMNCTLQADLLPEVVIKEGTTPRTPSSTSVRVFDVDLQEWRSFTWRSVKKVSFFLGDTAAFPTRAKPQ